MKKIITLVMILAGMTGMAQEKDGPKGIRNLTPEQMATLQTKKMTLALDLSKTQQEQMQALNIEKATARKEEMEKRKAAKEDGERKKPTSEERYAMQNARLDRMIADKAKVKKILSDQQYVKWEKMAYRKGKHRKGHRDKRNSKK